MKMQLHESGLSDRIDAPCRNRGSGNQVAMGQTQCFYQDL